VGATVGAGPAIAGVLVTVGTAAGTEVVVVDAAGSIVVDVVVDVVPGVARMTWLVAGPGSPDWKAATAASPRPSMTRIARIKAGVRADEFFSWSLRPTQPRVPSPARDGGTPRGKSSKAWPRTSRLAVSGGAPWRGRGVPGGR
jgi:hypothetical protein